MGDRVSHRQTELKDSPSTTGTKLSIWWLASPLVLVGLSLVYFVEPNERSFLPKCVLHQWTGLHCPGCGSTRAVHSILHGRFVQAFHFNPLLIIGVFLTPFFLWWKVKRPPGKPTINYRWTYVLTGLILAYYVARNVPSPTTSPLAPPRYVSSEPVVAP